MSVILQQSQLPHEGLVVDLLLGAYCSPELHCHHNSHGCIVSEQYTVHLLRNSCSSVRHFPDLSWIVEDGPCFSEELVCSVAIVFVESSFDLFTLSTYPVLLCFLHCLLNPLVCLLFLLHTTSSNLLSDHRVENISGDPWLFPVTVIPKYLTDCVVIMVFMSMSSSLRPMSGVNFQLIVAWKVCATARSLNFSGLNLSLGWNCILWSLQEYCSYMEPIVNQRRAKAEVPGEKLPNLLVQNLASHMCPKRGLNHSGERSNI